MPTIDAATVDEVLVLSEHPRVPSNRKAVAVVLDLDSAAYAVFEAFVHSSREAPVLRLSFGQDDRAVELAAARKALQAAEAEVAKYRAAYDKRPAPGAHRFNIIELD